MRSNVVLLALIVAACQSYQPTAQVSPAESEVARANIERWIAAHRIGGLCSNSEQIVFQCVAGHDRLAVCGGLLDQRPYLQFRQQSGGKLIRYPETMAAQQSLFHTASPFRTMGGEDHITFQRGGLEYDLYSINVGASFAASGHGKAEVQDGLTISNGANLISDIRCSETEVPVDLATAEKLGAARSE
jgi:hypothetical protein